MNQLESALLEEITSGITPLFILRTHTRIDAGRWWRRTPIWLCVTENEVILFAIARRRYVERIPIDTCHNTHYAHATGELVIDPAESLRIKRLSLTPREALDALPFLTKITTPL